MSNTEILICTTCRPAHEPADASPAGRTLLESVQEVMRSSVAAGVRPTSRLRGIACLSGCARACTMALQAHGKHTYVFGDLHPDAETAAQVVACAELHQKSSDGLLPRSERPPRLRKGILAKLPPAGCSGEEPQ